MAEILRYGTEEEMSVIYTPLDPLEDLSDLLAGLRSEQYVQSVLVKKHDLSMSEASEIAPLVGHHAAWAAGFLRQAYAGPPELSFLPVYYAVLSLSKVCILCCFGAERLRQDARYHGAKYPREQECDPLDCRISICERGGVFPLFYEALTGRKPEWEEIDVSTLLSLAPCIESELKMALGRSLALCSLGVSVEKVESQAFRLKVDIYLQHGMPSRPDEMVALRDCQLSKGVSNPSRDTYLGETMRGTSPDAVAPAMFRGIRRELLYYRPAPFFANMTTSTPAHTDFAVPEEIPLWLLFFWLSNVVRYAPERLSALQKTGLWPILLKLRKHGALRFLILFWSFFHKTSFGIKGGTM